MLKFTAEMFHWEGESVQYTFYLIMVTAVTIYMISMLSAVLKESVTYFLCEN